VTALWLLSQAVVALAAAGIVYRQSKPEREPEDGRRVTLGQMLRFGVEGLLGSTSPVETFRLDQALIGVFLSPIALGYYVVGLSFTNLPRFVAQSFGVVAYPLVAADRNAHSARRSMWTFFTVSVAFTAVFVIVLEISAGWFVPFFFGDEYREAIPVCRILLLYALFVSARPVLADGARGAGLPMSGTVAEVAAWAVLLPLLPFSVRWGVDAVGWSLTLSSLVGLVVLLWYLSSGRSRQHEAADVAVAGG
jgi:O-antigen/teichoic acid export membrane protein